MKVRNDFVTNSSSSSFVVAFKDLPDIDKETIDKYPFLAQYKKVISEAIFGNNVNLCSPNESNIFENHIDLQDYLVEEYGYNESFKELCKSDEYVHDLYDECIKYLKDGYKILIRDIDYDDYRGELFRKIESDDFIIISGENQ